MGHPGRRRIPILTAIPLLYSATLFVDATLLFVVQPMAASEVAHPLPSRGRRPPDRRGAVDIVVVSA